MIGRVGTFAHASALIGSGLQIQARLAEQQTQEASGHKSDSFSGLAGDAGSLLEVTGQSERLKAEATAATNAGALVQTAYTAVGGISDLAANIRAQISAALNGTNGTNGNSPITAQACQSWLSDLQVALNTQVGGQYVFAGQAADRPPVDFSAAGYNPAATPSAPDTAYYSGATGVRTVTTLDGSKLPVGVTADASGFEKLARALNTMAASPTNATTLQNSFDLVSQAVNEIGQTRAALSTQAASLDKLTSDDTDKSKTLDNIATQLNGADLASAAVMISQYQTQLQALFSTIGQLSKTSLLDYLR